MRTSLKQVERLLEPLREIAKSDRRIASLDVRLMPQHEQGTVWVILEVQFARGRAGSGHAGRIRDDFIDSEGDIAPTVGRWLLEWVALGVLPPNPWRDIARRMAGR